MIFGLWKRRGIHKKRKTAPSGNFGVYGWILHLWSAVDFAGNLVLMVMNEASVNMLKQSSAVMILMKEVAGFELLAGLIR